MFCFFVSLKINDILKEKTLIKTSTLNQLTVLHTNALERNEYLIQERKRNTLDNSTTTTTPTTTTNSISSSISSTSTTNNQFSSTTTTTTFNNQTLTKPMKTHSNRSKMNSNHKTNHNSTQSALALSQCAFQATQVCFFKIFIYFYLK